MLPYNFNNLETATPFISCNSFLAINFPKGFNAAFVAVELGDRHYQ